MFIISVFEKYTVEDKEYSKSRRKFAAFATHPQRLQWGEKDLQRVAMEKALQTVEEEPGQKVSDVYQQGGKHEDRDHKDSCQKAFRLTPRATQRSGGCSDGGGE